MAKSNKRKLSGPNGPSDLSSKRSRSSATVGRENSAVFGQAFAPVDPVTGQRAAFPGLDQDEDGELFYGPADDGLSYLRMVRSEARTVPNLLVAPQEGQDSPQLAEEISSLGGFYEDGAFTADQEHEDMRSVDDENQAQNAYYQILCKNFSDLRTRLRRDPPHQALQELREHQPISFGSDHKDYSVWRSALRTRIPNPAQIASLEPHFAFKALKLITETMLKERRNISTSVSIWIWSLLAVLPDIGCCDSESVSIVRELGKRAVEILKIIRAFDRDLEEEEEQIPFPEVERAKKEEEVPIIHQEGEGERDDRNEIWKMNGASCESGSPNGNRSGADLPKENIPSKEELGLIEVLEDNGDGGSASLTADSTQDKCSDSPQHSSFGEEDGEYVNSSDEAEELEAARQRLLERLGRDFEGSGRTERGDFPSKNTLLTVDMILTIAGEFYGQRDLLEFREVWGEFA